MKREYLKVNVIKTCEDIIQYILVQVEPLHPGAPRPRFSLYLSAQLEYGVVRVYHKQCLYLIDDVQQTLERLNRMDQQLKIDLVELEQPGLLLPDALNVMDTFLDAPNPFFGVMGIDELPSPLEIPQVHYILEARTPSPRRSPEQVPKVYPKKPEKPAVTVALPEAITLKEVEPVRMPEAEYERELPEITAREIQMLIEQGEAEFVEEAAEVEKPKEPSELERIEEERGLELEMLEEIVLSPERITEVPGPEFDAVVLLDEETGKPFVVSPVPTVPPVEITPHADIILPASPPVPVSPRRPELVSRSPELILPEVYEFPVTEPKRRRRQLPFIDERIQISREDLLVQMSDINTQCRNLVFVEPASRRSVDAADLLARPTYSGWLPNELQRLWTRCANVEKVDYVRRRALEAEEEAEEARREETLSELEVIREGLEPSIPLMLSSEISLDVTEEEKARPSPVIAEEKRIEELVIEEERPSLPALMEVPEIVVPTLEPIREDERLDETFVQRMAREEIEHFGETDFETLAPHTVSSLSASKIFYCCLVLSGARILKLEQSEPYGQIIIKPGPRF